ncbi:hypothetical protein EXIGLDRAFT_828545 [Exidia glandulosa HHB12029]|uniref:Nibrin second BRCT domain-containing protein n=1 Tax=Exidia glandulosa HHB12029 TaxID=1314781 RepID=A0A165Q6N0_EXIGL|nr:hypothetical protein EXIGLDRAFT_828545 [Exidia glandulosa HHB12029]
MWLLLAPFDHKDDDSLDQKYKLLKTGTTYTLTRDEKAPAGSLKIKSKQLSKDHGKYKVGQHSEDDVTKLDVVPTLKLSNSRDVKPITVKRSGQSIEVHHTADIALQSGDVLVIGQGRKTITASWERIVLFWRPSSKELSPATKICASIGMKLSFTFVDIITHHVTPTLDLSDACIASLLVGAAHVTKAWIDRVFELAQLPPENGGLDDTFILPDPSDFAPPFSEEHAPWARSALWKDDDARETIFDGLRFLIVTDGEPIEQFGTNIVKCGGGYDTFNVRDGLDRWDRTIAASRKRAGKAKGGMHSSLVVVVDEDDIKTALAREWDDFVSSLHSEGLHYVSAAAVRLAILDKKVKKLDCFYDAAADSQFIPGTIADEPSQLALSSQPGDAGAPARRRAPRRGTTPAESQLTEPSPAEESQPARRGTKRTRAASVAPDPEEPEPKRPTRRSSRAPSAAPEPAPPVVAPTPAPVEEEEEDIFAPPKFPLRNRRTRAAAASLITGLEGDPSIIASQSQTQDTQPPARDEEPDFAPRKRRAATATQSRGFSLKIGDDDDDEEQSASQAAQPALKKYRALFEGTEDPSSMSGGETSFADFSRSNATSQTQARSGARANTQLSAVMELDEDSQQVSRELPLTAGTSTAGSLSGVGTKRRRDNDGDVEMAEQPPAAKKRKDTQTSVSSAKITTKETATTTTKTGAVGGVMSAPDKNDKVLTALASLKRGKRTEDAFDREFNALRISKPESEAERRAREEDEFFAHFDFDEGLRGKKCIEVCEYVLPERQQSAEREMGASAERSAGGRGPLGVWKPQWEGVPNFKKFKKVVRGAVVSTVQDHNDAAPRVELVCAEEDKDYGMGNAYWSRPSGGSQSQSQSQSQQMDDSFTVSQQRAKLRMPDFDVSDSEDAPPPPKTKARGGRSQASQAAPKKAAPKKATPLFIDDDSEEEDTPTMDGDYDAPSTLAETITQSGRGTARGRGTLTQSKFKKPITIVDSDSDDGMTFKSFKRQARKR